MIFAQLSEAVAKSKAHKDRAQALGTLLTPELLNQQRERLLDALATVMTEKQIDRLHEVLGVGDDAEDQEHMRLLFMKGLDRRLKVSIENVFIDGRNIRVPAIHGDFSPIRESKHPEVQAFYKRPRSSWSSEELDIAAQSVVVLITYFNAAWRYDITAFSEQLAAHDTGGWKKGQPKDILKAVNAAVAAAADEAEKLSQKYITNKAAQLERKA